MQVAEHVLVDGKGFAVVSHEVTCGKAGCLLFDRLMMRISKELLCVHGSLRH